MEVQTPEVPPELDAAPSGPAGAAAARRRTIDLRGRSLRQHAARGTIINGAFVVGLNTLGLLRGFILAALLSRGDYGVWGLLAVGVGSIYWFKQVGISDKYVQQDEPDQELAFQKALTLDALLNLFFSVIVAIAIPLVALAYGQPRIIAPAYVLLLALPAVVFQSPLWVHYRTMDFVRQRTLQAFDPIVGFVVMVALAALGFGYWALVLGALAGNYASAAACLVGSPYRVRFRYDRGTLRQYSRFSWPLFVGQGSRFIANQAWLLVGVRHLGLAAVGSITLASQMSSYTQRVDQILADTLYPAICAVKDRVDLLFESFVKSNRLALLWGVPLGVGMALFASDVVTYAIGERWRGAVTLFVVFGLLAAANQLAYNWDDYLRARNTTTPVAWWGVINLIGTVGITTPLLLWKGLDGYAIGMSVSTAISIGGRIFFLRKLFPAFAMISHMAYAVAPTISPTAVVLAMRLGASGHRTEVLAAAEAVVYLIGVIACTIAIENDLLREIRNYLRRDRSTVAAPA